MQKSTASSVWKLNTAENFCWIWGGTEKFSIRRRRKSPWERVVQEGDHNQLVDNTLFKKKEKKIFLDVSLCSILFNVCMYVSLFHMKIIKFKYRPSKTEHLEFYLRLATSNCCTDYTILDDSIQCKFVTISKVKLSPFSQGRPEVSLFNSYNTEV